MTINRYRLQSTPKRKQFHYLILSLQHKTKFHWVFWVKLCSLTRKKFLKWHIKNSEQQNMEYFCGQHVCVTTGQKNHKKFCNDSLFKMISTNYRVGQKSKPVWMLITLRWLLVGRHVICPNFQNVVERKGQTCIAKHLNILCLLCINLHYPWN